MWHLGLSLAILAAGALALRNKCMVLVALALLVNWGINTAIVHMTGDDFPWGFFIASDYITGIAVLFGMMAMCEKPSVGAIVIALSYVVECIAHVAYGVSTQNAWSKYHYYWLLFDIAVSQAVFVFTWGLYDLARSGMRVSPRFTLRKGDQ